MNEINMLAAVTSVRAVSEGILVKVGESFPNVFGAVVLLILGWIVALLGRSAARRGLRYLKANTKLASLTGFRVDIEAIASRTVYYGILVFVLIAFFSTLNLLQVSSPLQKMAERVLVWFPNLVAAVILALIAWILATGVRAIVGGSLDRVDLDSKLGGGVEGLPPPSQSLGQAAYWLTLLLFLPGVLGTLGLKEVLRPVEHLVDKILLMLPNVVAALILGFLGWAVAKILGGLVTHFLAATRIDEIGKRGGLDAGITLSRIAGTVTHFLVFVPALIAAIDALQIDAVSGPATRMLETLLSAVPGLLAAALILGAGVLIARLVSRFLADAFKSMGLDRLPGFLGFEGAPDSGPWTLSRIAERIVLVVIVVVASVEAGQILGFTSLSDHLGVLISAGGRVLLGVLVIAAGLWIARGVEAMLRRLSSEKDPFWPGLAKMGIVGLVFAMGLGAMGIADEIVRMAFGLTLGAVAVAFALAFGLGGREAAGRQMTAWLKNEDSGRPTGSHSQGEDR